MMINAGYNHIHGNRLRATGHCGPETEAAIVWYQRLLNMSPSGVVHLQQIWFFTMFSKSLTPHWRPRVSGPLHVSEGQLTFDAEGKDYLTAVSPFRQPERVKNFSRILYWPGKNSGVTLGRGYDMGARSQGQILTQLRQAGIEEYKAVICANASGLHGRHAIYFVANYGPLVGEITHIQQIKLFEISYREKRVYAQFFYQKFSKSVKDAPSWEQLDLKIRDVVVDIFYQSAHDVSGLINAAIKGKKALAEYIKNDPIYSSFEDSRQRIRYMK